MACDSHYVPRVVCVVTGPPGKFVWAGLRVCCHEVDAPEKETDPCQVPWGHVEWLKIPDIWIRNRPVDVQETDRPLISMIDPPAKFYCLNGRRSLSPEENGAIFWMPWDEEKGATKPGLPPEEWEMPEFYQTAKLLDNGDLECSGRHRPERAKGPHQHLKPQTYEKFFGRPAYHLFSSLHQPVDSKVLSQDDILQNDWILSYMYRKALGVTKRKVVPTPAVVDHEAQPDWSHIFTWYDYRLNRDRNPFVDLNIRTWKKLNPGMKVVLVNRSNIKEWVPDLPAEASLLWNDDDWKEMFRAASVYVVQPWDGSSSLASLGVFFLLQPLPWHGVPSAIYYSVNVSK